MTPFLLVLLSATLGPGWDFSLPSSVRPDPYSGLIWMDNAINTPEVPNEGHTLSWADLNPGEGVYDFSPVVKILDAAQGRGRGVLLRLKCGDVVNKTPWGDRPPMVPRWVLDKHHPATVDMAGGDDSAYADVVIHSVLPWDPGIQEELLKFVEAFGRTGLAGHPALLGLYVHGISTSLGEEFWFSEKAFRNLEKAGMTPEKLERAFATRIRAWSRAFGERAGKLAWVGVGWIPAPDAEWEAYKKVQTDLNHLAVEQGLGYRGGGIERYNQVSDAAGQTVDGEGYFVNDPKNPILAQKRYYGDENEIYDPKDPDAAYRYRMATLRSLQMGMRFNWVGEEGVSLDPAVSQYFNLTAGKSLAEAPDAWCCLREAKAQRGGRSLLIRNFERGLIQREAEGFRTKPALFTGPLKDFGDEPSSGEWAGRSTDLSAGQAGIGFRVEPAFWNGAGPRDMVLKVTFLDEGSLWKVVTSAVSGLVKSESVKGSGDGKTKTVAFRILGFHPSGQLPQGFDIALIAEKGDLQANFVRLIR